MVVVEEEEGEEKEEEGNEEGEEEGNEEEEGEEEEEEEEGKVRKTKMTEHSCSTALTFADDYTFSNVYLYPNVPHLYKCIFVPQCAPLLQMYICAPMCPNVPQCTPLLQMYICTPLCIETRE